MTPRYGAYVKSKVYLVVEAGKGGKLEGLVSKVVDTRTARRKTEITGEKRL